MNQYFLSHVFIFLAAATIMVPIASRFKVGSIPGYLFVGILIGPHVLKLMGNSAQIMDFAEFGVIMMLFLIGLEVEPGMLWKLKKLILGLGGLQVLVTTAVLTGVGLLCGYEWPVSLAVSMSLALSSTALVLKRLEEKNMLRTKEGGVAFSVLLFQDIAVIPILIIMPLLGQYAGMQAVNHDEFAFLAHVPAWLHALLVAGVTGAVIILGHYVSRPVFLMIARTNLREIFTTFSLAMVVGITLLMKSIGVSPALGAFIAGVVLANSQYKHTVEADIEPFKGLFLGLFFISVGMEMNIPLLVQKTGLILAVVSGLIAIKALVLFGLGCIFRFPWVQSVRIALALSQGGEFAFVLFQYASSLGVIDSTLKAQFTLIVALSMLLTPFLMLMFYRFVLPRHRPAVPARSSYDAIYAKNDIILVGYGRFGQIIGRLLNGEKINITVLEKNPEQIELLRKFGYKGYFGDASRLDILKSAGADQAQLLVVTVGSASASLKIVKMAKQHFPRLSIYARARNRRHAYDLHKLGVDYFKRELFDSSLTMTKEILKFIGYPSEDIENKATAFQQHDDNTLVKSFDFFEEEDDLIMFSRQASSELEQILESS